MIKESFPAMGTTITAIARTEDDVARTRDLFACYERRFSRFDAESELSLVNASTREAVEVSPDMAEILTLAKDLQQRTAGVFDPALGNGVIAWGYDRSFDQIPDDIEAPDHVPLGEWAIDGVILTRQPGTKLDLGGIAKGWAADQAVTRGHALLVSAGGDIRSAIDDAQVEIIDEFGREPAVVHLGAKGLATSSTMRRRWTAGHRSANHIVDPTTRAPAVTPVLAASARCGTAAEAEAAAKTLVLLGEHGLEWADDQGWVEAAMVAWHDGAVFATAGWEMAA